MSQQNMHTCDEIEPLGIYRWLEFEKAQKHTRDCMDISQNKNGTFYVRACIMAYTARQVTKIFHENVTENSMITTEEITVIVSARVYILVLILCVIFGTSDKYL